MLYKCFRFAGNLLRRFPAEIGYFQGMAQDQYRGTVRQINGFAGATKEHAFSVVFHKKEIGA